MPAKKLVDVGRISTGVSGLDETIEGGLIAGKTYLVTGGAGTGKTILGLQFLWSGIKSNERCLYVALCERPRDIFAGAACFGWNLPAAYQKKQLTLLDAGPYFARRPNQRRRPWSATFQAPNVIADLMKHVRNSGATRLVIDPIDPIVDAVGPENSFTFCRQLVWSLETALGCTTYFTVSRPPNEVAGRHSLELFASGLMELDYTEDRSRFRRRLLIKKLRATQTERRIGFFEIVPQKGIVFENVDYRPVEELGAAGLLREVAND